MKEYTITMNFIIEADNESDYERISEFAEQLSENIMDDNKLIFSDGIEIVGVQIQNVEDNNFDENDYLNEEDD